LDEIKSVTPGFHFTKRRHSFGDAADGGDGDVQVVFDIDTPGPSGTLPKPAFKKKRQRTDPPSSPVGAKKPKHGNAAIDAPPTARNSAAASANLSSMLCDSPEWDAFLKNTSAKKTKK